MIGRPVEFALHHPDSPLGRRQRRKKTGMKNLLIKFRVSASPPTSCRVFRLLPPPTLITMPPALALGRKKYLKASEMADSELYARSRKGVFGCVKLLPGDKPEMASIWMGECTRADCTKSEL